MDIFMLVANPNHSFIAFLALMTVAISALAELIGQRYGACLESSVMDGSLAYYVHGTHSDQYRNSGLVRDLWYGTCD
jgi:hypothetical protein